MLAATPHLREETWTTIIQTLQKAEVDDPCLVIQWDFGRLAAVDATFQQPAVRAQLVAAGMNQAGCTKEAVLSYIYSHGGERIGPATAAESIIFFREPSIMVACKQELAAALPFAHALSPTAALLVPAAVVTPRIARPFVVFKTDRVEPDIAESDFFYG
jgi:hypothetical protein